MRTQIARTLAARRFKPGLAVLEGRAMPSVSSIALAGLTPSPGSTNTVFIGGIVDLSSSTSASSLSVSYKVTNVQGNLLASGPLAASPSAPGSLNYGFGTTIPLSVAPGNIETIAVFATDSDSVGVPKQAVANLYVSTSRGFSTLGFGITASNGDIFGGSGQGKISMTQSASKGLLARGKASFGLGSNPYNHTLLTSTANGTFQLGIDPLGDLSYSITRGKANFKVGAYAGAPLSTGGVGGVISGNFRMTRYYDSSLVAQGQGSAYLSFQVGGSGTTTPTANTVTALSHKMTIGINTDSTGQLRFNLAGNMTVNGNFNPSSS